MRRMFVSSTLLAVLSLTVLVSVPPVHSQSKPKAGKAVAAARSRYGGTLHRQPPGGVGAEAGRQHGEDDRSAATVLHADGTGGEAGLAGAEQGVDYRAGGGRWARGTRRHGRRGWRWSARRSSRIRHAANHGL